MTIFLEKDILLYAAQKMAETHGTLFAVRDDNAFESALARARNSAEYDDTADLSDLAADYAFGIVKNHPLSDGNKRLSYVACRLFLILNGQDFNLTEDEKYRAIVNLAASHLTRDDFAALIRNGCKNRVKKNGGEK